MNTLLNDLSGKRVVVTGATGFIGGRLVEKLVLECKADVTALVRSYSTASRIARFPVKIVKADLTKLEDIESAIHGADIVVHCAYGSYGSKKTTKFVNVQGTKNILEASLRAKIERVIHLSSVVVYGLSLPEQLEETSHGATRNKCIGIQKLMKKRSLRSIEKNLACRSVCFNRRWCTDPMGNPGR